MQMRDPKGVWGLGVTEGQKTSRGEAETRTRVPHPNSIAGWSQALEGNRKIVKQYSEGKAPEAMGG